MRIWLFSLERHCVLCTVYNHVCFLAAPRMHVIDTSELAGERRGEERGEVSNFTVITLPIPTLSLLLFFSFLGWAGG